MKVVVMNKQNMSIKHDAQLEADYVAIDTYTGKLSVLNAQLDDSNNYDNAIDTLHQHNVYVDSNRLVLPISDFVYMI